MIPVSTEPDPRGLGAQRPAPGTARPAAVLAVAGGAPTTPVWRNGVGGLTFRIDDPRAPRFVKWDPPGSGESLAAEAARLVWLEGRFAVPRLIAHGGGEEGDWLETEAIPGESAVSERGIAQPAIAARAIGAGLRSLHDSVPAGECPFDWTVPARIAEARREGTTVDDALLSPPSVDRLVVCHGDACAPNTLLDDSGSFRAIVDVGRLGTADRWADLAIASWSLGWNYGSGHERAFWDGYGVDPDPVRIAYYRALWDAT